MQDNKLNNMQNKQLAQTVDKWRQYICNKLANPRSHKDATELLKKLNNNQTHIHSAVTHQSRIIIDKIVHAFSESLITIYDTNLFESICDIIFSHDGICAVMLSDDTKKCVRDYITQSPWLATLHQGFIRTLDLIREYVAASYIDTEKSNLSLHNHINETIYNIINCWIISCVTLLFCKALFCMPTLELNLPYLFFVAASYSIVDFAIDDNTTKLPIVKTILKMFEQGITCHAEIAQFQFAEIPKHILNAIKHLIQTYNHHADPNTTKLNAIFYSMATEKECFKRQRAENITNDEIITLTINKGLSTGYLIIAGLPQKLYDLHVNSDDDNNHNNQNLFSQYCILLQLLDDLSDYTQDSAAGITTSAKLFTTYPEFAWFVLDCLLDFLQAIQGAGIFDKWLNNGFNIVFVNYWCYCCNKNNKLIYDVDIELINLITANYMFDMEYVLQMREQKHKKKYELYKLILRDQTQFF